MKLKTEAQGPGSQHHKLALGELYLSSPVQRQTQTLWSSALEDVGVEWNNRLSAFVGWYLYCGPCGLLQQINDTSPRNIHVVIPRTCEYIRLRGIKVASQLSLG